MVVEAKEILGVKLPEIYIDLLKIQNGGYIHFDANPLNGDGAVHVDYIMGIGNNDSVMQSNYLIKEWGLPKNVVLFSGDGHSWIAFDYRKVKENPPIIYIEVEAEQIVELAPDFIAFIDGLYIQKVHLIDDEVLYHFESREWNQKELETAGDVGSF